MVVLLSCGGATDEPGKRRAGHRHWTGSPWSTATVGRNDPRHTRPCACLPAAPGRPLLSSRQQSWSRSVTPVTSQGRM